MWLQCCTHGPRVSPAIIYYHNVAYKTWTEIVQIICDHRIDMPVVLQCAINAMKMNDIFYTIWVILAMIN